MHPEGVVANAAEKKPFSASVPCAATEAAKEDLALKK